MQPENRDAEGLQFLQEVILFMLHAIALGSIYNSRNVPGDKSIHVDF